MIDYFLLYSLNIIIIIMVYHTYMTAHIGEAFAPNEDDMEIHRVTLQASTYFLYAYIEFYILTD